MDCWTLGSPVLHYLPLLKFMPTESVMLSNHLILRANSLEKTPLLGKIEAKVVAEDEKTLRNREMSELFSCALMKFTF